MSKTRPTSDLKNNFTDISQLVHESNEPVFLTENGHKSMVVMSMETFDNLYFESEIYSKLKEAEKEAEISNKRFSSEEVLRAIKEL